MQMVFKKDMSGEGVKNRQGWLWRHGYFKGLKNGSSYKLSVDGVFGEITKQAVKKFQSSQKLSVDGIIGRVTQAKIDEITRKETKVGKPASVSRPPQPATKPKINTILILAAGHGGFDPGAVYRDETEREAAIIQTDTVYKATSKRFKGVHVVPHIFRLKQTIFHINGLYFKDAMAIEIHKNAGSKSARRIEVYYSAVSRNLTKRKEQAERLAALIAKETGIPNGGGRPDTSSARGRLGFCRDVKYPSLLVEMNFLEQPDNERKLGEALGRALIRFYGG